MKTYIVTPHWATCDTIYDDKEMCAMAMIGC